jgi:TonB-linked SusC/RagA family outer membrane protein
VCFTLFCFCSTIALAQSKGTDVSAVVVDEEGNPLNDVNVFGAKGIQSSTDANGKFNIVLLDGSSIVLQKNGYESKLVNISEITGTITIVKSLFLASESDEIKMGVTTRDRREVVGATSSINPSERLTFDNTQVVTNYISGLMLGIRGGSNIRGIGNAIFVIDGVFGRIPNFLNMEEVEQITVLKDANAIALYGSQARNGVIIINTKRGKINKKEVNVNVISGIRVPVALPKYLGAADYMELFNEALENDGGNGGTSFSLEDIANTRSGVNPYQYPDVDYYSDEYVQPFINTLNVITEFSGGNEKSQFYVNVGWNKSESWENLNPDANKGSNRFNVRGNIDFKVNDWITSSLDGIAIINTNKSAFSSLFNAGVVLKPNEYTPLLPISLLDPGARPESGLTELLGSAKTFDGFLLGTNQQFGPNAPIAQVLAGGTQNNIYRVTQFNNTINFDLSAITEGLSAKTYLSFDFFDSYRLSVRNQIQAYVVGYSIPDPNNADSEIPVEGWENGRIVGLTGLGADRQIQVEAANTNDFVSRLGFYSLLNYQKTFATNHSINSTFLGYYNSQQRNNVLQTNRDSHLGFQVTYDFKKKIFADFSGAYSHSIKLPEGNRGGLSPTFGLSYILSEEAFLKDSKFVNYLKLRATGGIIKSDARLGYYLYDEAYSDGSNFSWADGQSSNRLQNISQGENFDLTFEERIDLNLGFETYLMNSLWLEFNYFRTEIDKRITVLADQYPSFYSSFRPFNNFNADLYKGAELGLSFNKSFKDFSVNVGANVLYTETEASKRSETNEFAYQNRSGRELSSIIGLQDEGFYSEADFTLDSEGNRSLNTNLPVPNFGNVQPGDIKYTDQNGDNIIDDNDRVFIGQRDNSWTYGVNVNLKYKGFNVFVLGRAQTGGKGNKLSSTFNNYYSVDGDDKYSEVVLDRWTPETADTATFPRLSAVNSQNNFRPSTFWLYDNSFFRIDRAQLTYEFTDEICDILGVKDFSFNLQGTNLLEISKNKDIRQLNVGGSPQTKSYTFGVRLAF